MLGVINLRGIVVPVFDLKKRFAMAETEKSKKSVVIILTLEDRTIGILVDAVSDIVNINKDQIKPAPKMERIVDEEYLSGLLSVEERMVVLLNVENLFSQETLDSSEAV